MIDESIIKEQKQNKAVDDYLDEIDYTWEAKDARCCKGWGWC